MSRKAKIIGFQGSWGSGLAYLIIENKQGNQEFIVCENGETVRALEACFGNVITSGHTVNNDSIKGKEIEFETGDFGLLEWFKSI